MRTPKRRTADDVRNDLERVREKQRDGRISSAEYAHASARLLDELDRVSKARHAYAKT